MSIKYNQKGFAAIEAVLIFVVAAIIGGTGYYVYHSNNNTNKTLLSSSSSDSGPVKTDKKKFSNPLPAQQSAPTKQAAAPSSNYLVFKEWGVKLAMTDANKITYTYNSNCQEVVGQCDSFITLQVKSAYLQNKSCKLSIGASRFTSIDPRLASNSKKVGGYYYMSDGNPYNCGDTPDNNLNSAIRSEFNISKLQST